MKKRFKFNFNILKRLIVAIFVIVLILVLPTLGLRKNDNLSMIYSTFIGSKSKYQGIIEIWNVDSFESGTISKTNLLNNLAKAYQKKYKGLYFMVRNLTETECINLISQGEKPDLMSCSYGVASELKDIFVPYSKDFNVEISENLLKAGKTQDGLMAVAYAQGFYTLISTRERLEKAGRVFEDLNVNYKLSDVVFDLGYEIVGKKNTKQVYSLGFGDDKNLLPQMALKTYNKKGLQSKSNLSYKEMSVSQYSAYCDFIAGYSTILLGTQRDVYRIENRVNLGKLSDVIYESVLGFSDLVQFMLITNIENNDKLFYAQDFVRFITGEVGQNMVLNAGLVSVVNSSKLLINSSIMQDIVPQILESNTKFNNIFISKDEIVSLKQNFNFLE